MPTFSNLSPLRQSISNPNMKEAADLVLTFGATGGSGPSRSSNTGGDPSTMSCDTGLQIGEFEGDKVILLRP